MRPLLESLVDCAVHVGPQRNAGRPELEFGFLDDDGCGQGLEFLLVCLDDRQCVLRGFAPDLNAVDLDVSRHIVRRHGAVDAVHPDRQQDEQCDGDSGEQSEAKGAWHDSWLSEPR